MMWLGIITSITVAGMIAAWYWYGTADPVDHLPLADRMRALGEAVDRARRL